MADFDLEEWKRQQAAFPQGQYIVGSPGGPTVASLNRPPSEWGTPLPPNPAVDASYAERGLPTAGEQNAPGFTGANTILANGVSRLPTSQEQSNLGIGNYIDRQGNIGSPTQDAGGFPTPVPQGTVGVQGVVSPQEQAFWAAHPNGIGVPSNYSGSGAPPPGTPGVDSRVFNPRTGNWEGSFPPPVGGTSGRLVPPEVFGGLSQPNQPATNPDYGQQINDYYTQKRADIQAQKAPLMVHLGMADPSSIGASGTTLLNKQGGRHGQPSEYERGLMQLRNLNAQENQILSEHHAAVTENAKTQHENLVRQTHIDAANGITKLSTGLNYVNQTYQKGTPQYQAAVTELLQDPQIAQAVTTKGGQSILAPHLKAHEDTSAVAQRLQDAGYAVTPRSVGASGGVSYSVKPAASQENIPEGALISHGRLLDLVAAHEQAAAKEAAANTAANKPNTPYSQSSRLQANRQALADFENKYPSLAQSGATPDAPQTATQAGAVKHLGRYNPQTGNFE